MWIPSVDTVVVVPCFNEARRLDTEAFLAFVEAQDTVGLLMVDDGSADDTSQVLERLEAAAHGRIRALTLSSNRGKAEAVRTGVMMALEEDVAAVGFWDADLATELTTIPLFRDELLSRPPSVLAIIGSRVKLLGREIERSTTRHYLGRVFATVASIVLALPVYDTQCGAKLFRAGPQIREVFARPFRSRWVFDVEILARLGVLIGNMRLSQSVVEYPLLKWTDVAGSKLRPTAMITSFVQLLLIRRRALSDMDKDRHGERRQRHTSGTFDGA